MRSRSWFRPFDKIVALVVVMTLLIASLSSFGLLPGIASCCPGETTQAAVSADDDCCPAAQADGAALHDTRPNDAEHCPCPFPCGLTCRAQVPTATSAATVLELYPRMTERSTAFARPELRPATPEPNGILHVPRPFRA